MEKIFFLAMAALLCSINNVSAQVITIYKDAEVVATYTAEQADSVVFSETSTPSQSTHEYVDFDLPSGTLWATCNIGAEYPEEHGLYFAWGEIIGHSGAVNEGTNQCSDDYSYIWSTAPFNDGQSSYDSDYFRSIGREEATGYAYGTELLAKYDAATVNWGSDWQMPNQAQITELKDECIWTWDATSKGYVVSKNGKSIFLPAAGLRYNKIISSVETDGSYWSRTLDNSYQFYAYMLGFFSSDQHVSCSYRFYGRSIRPVRIQK